MNLGAALHKVPQALPILPPPLPVFPTGPLEKFSTVTLRLDHKYLGAASLIVGLVLFVQEDKNEYRMRETISGFGVEEGSLRLFGSPPELEGDKSQVPASFH